MRAMSKDLLWHHGVGYAGPQLDVTTVADDPLEQFRVWFREAEARGLSKVNAMTLATATPAGRPSARIVLLKELDDRGFVFYTNYESQKGAQLAANPQAALVFFWDGLDRQVRIEGAVERVSDAESDAYFAVRPRPSRLGAIASPQSRPLASREELAARVATLDRELGDREPARPAAWGGYRLVPDLIELWQGQPSRLHDRVVYRRAGDAWTRERLAP
jgi:pyridoxamine 5'-phosphate oxidase